MSLTTELAQTVDEDFKALKKRHFDPLHEKFGLSLDHESSGTGFATASAASGYVRIFFEYERGLCSFAIGPADQTKSLCGIEEIANRFPRIRSLPEGDQRLSLDEQATFLSAHWDDLQVMFSPDQIGATLKWRAAAAAALTKRYSRDT